MGPTQPRTPALRVTRRAPRARDHQHRSAPLARRRNPFTTLAPASPTAPPSANSQTRPAFVSCATSVVARVLGAQPPTVSRARVPPPRLSRVAHVSSSALAVPLLRRSVGTQYAPAAILHAASARLLARRLAWHAPLLARPTLMAGRACLRAHRASLGMWTVAVPYATAAAPRAPTRPRPAVRPVCLVDRSMRHRARARTLAPSDSTRSPPACVLFVTQHVPPAAGVAPPGPHTARHATPMETTRRCIPTSVLRCVRTDTTQIRRCNAKHATLPVAHARAAHPAIVSRVEPVHLTNMAPIVSPPTPVHQPVPLRTPLTRLVQAATPHA